MITERDDLFADVRSKIPGTAAELRARAAELYAEANAKIGARCPHAERWRVIQQAERLRDEAERLIGLASWREVVC
jgi:hypothetical protein